MPSYRSFQENPPPAVLQMYLDTLTTAHDFLNSHAEEMRKRGTKGYLIKTSCLEAVRAAADMSALATQVHRVINTIQTSGMPAASQDLEDLAAKTYQLSTDYEARFEQQGFKQFISRRCDKGWMTWLFDRAAHKREEAANVGFDVKFVFARSANDLSPFRRRRTWNATPSRAF